MSYAYRHFPSGSLSTLMQKDLAQDNTAGNRGTVCGEFGLREEVLANFGFELGEVYSPNTSWYKPHNRSAAAEFYRDMVQVFQNLHAVTNSAEGAVGGGGEPRRPPAPPLCERWE